MNMSIMYLANYLYIITKRIILSIIKNSNTNHFEHDAFLELLTYNLLNQLHILPTLKHPNSIIFCNKQKQLSIYTVNVDA